MGHIPIPPMPTSAAMFLAYGERRLRREMRGRTSRLPRRRRRAHAACLTLIRALEAVNDMAPDPWALRAPPKAPDLRRRVEAAEVMPAESRSHLDTA